MADSFVKTYKYSKGIYEAAFYSNATRDLTYYDSKLTDANIASSVNMGEIVAGLGNTTQIMIFDSAKFNITMTAQDIDLRQYALQTGGTLSYNGISRTCELITANTTTLTLNNTPVAPYGYTTGAVCYINGGGTAYAVNTSTKVVQGFTATPGTQYAVTYYVAPAANQALDIKSLFTPDIQTCEIKMPIYQAAVGASATSGSICGYLWAIVPRYQFNGESSLNATQTDNVKPSLAGQALAYDATTATACGNGGLSSLLYLVWEPISQTDGVVDMVVLGGGELSVEVGGTASIPVKFVMADGGLSQPDLTSLTYASSASSTASVANGVVSGVAAGSAEITITSTTPALTAVCQVEVTT